jgi:hypothetical protein
MSRRDSRNTISDKQWRELRDRAIRHENERGGSVSDRATARRKAQDPKKAGQN